LYQFRNVKVTGLSGPLLSIANVTGTGLAGAEKIDADKLPKAPEPVAAPAVAYQLH
jgi:hypothetical protein